MHPEEPRRAIRADAVERFRAESLEMDMENVDARKLIEELRIHQIELEIQNEELRQAQQRVAEVAEQYSDLYDFAPVGYLTLDRNTVIRQANLTATALLGMGREKLLNKPLITRVPAAYHGLLNTHIRTVLARRDALPCELEIRRPDGRRLWVTLLSSLDVSNPQELWCRVTLTDITKLKETERALRESEEKYRLIADNTIDCIWRINLDMQFEYVNPAIFPMLGYQPEEWLRTRLPDHCPLADLQAITGFIAGEIAGGGGVAGITLETVLLHKNGRQVPVEINGKVLFNERGEPVGLQGVARDISERRQAEQEIRKFKMLAEHATYGVLIADLSGVITYANTTFAAMHGYQVEELLGRNLILLSPRGDWSPIHINSAGALAYDEFGARELTHVRKDGAQFPVLLSCTLVRDANGAADFLAITAADITELKSLEAQLQQAQKMEAIGQLAGGIAHDFNNLLTVVINRADFIKEALPPFSLSRSDTEEIIEASMRGAALIRQLLAFSRRQHLTMKPVDLNAVLQGIQKMLRRLIGEDIQLNLQLTGRPCSISADTGQLEQVVINLAVNARDAMPNGGILTLETRRVNVGAGDVDMGTDADLPAPGSYVALSVTDTGTGMDKAIQVKIFDPFFTTKEVGKGSGLGLSTVHGIIKQHKGFIHVYSEPAKGATFRILLPLQSGVEGDESPVVAVAQSPAGHETILLVEDDPAVRRTAARMLRELGYRILEAEDGHKALAYLRQDQERIDLLLTDMVMPELDGRQLAEQAVAIAPDLKVIFTSGYPEAHLKLRNAWVGQHTLIQKPFILSELAGKVRATLDA